MPAHPDTAMGPTRGKSWSIRPGGRVGPPRPRGGARGERMNTRPSPADRPATRGLTAAQTQTRQAGARKPAKETARVFGNLCPAAAFS